MAKRKKKDEIVETKVELTVNEPTLELEDDKEEITTEVPAVVEPQKVKKPKEERKPPARVIPSWEDIRDRVSSISAMKRDLTGERITYGDALAIYKTDAHRRLYEEWAKSKK